MKRSAVFSLLVGAACCTGAWWRLQEAPRSSAERAASLASPPLAAPGHASAGARSFAAVPDPEPARILGQLTADRLSSEFAEGLLARWATACPADAAAWVEQLETGAARARLLRIVAVSWAEADATGAVRWLEQHPAGADRDLIAAALGHELVRSHPWEALLIAERMPADAARELRERAIAEAAAEDPFAALRFVAEYFGGEDGRRLIAQVAIASVEGGGDGADAAFLVQRQLPPGELRDRALAGVLQEWVQREPARAAQWLMDFPEFCALRPPVIESLIGAWMSAAPHDLTRWLDSVGDPRLRDMALKPFAEKLALHDPAAAAEWLLRMSDDAQREEGLRQVVATWRDRDAAAAENWLARAPLSSAAKLRLHAAPLL